MEANTPTMDTTKQQQNPINVNINIEDNKAGEYIVNTIKTFVVKNIDKILQSIAKSEMEEVVDIMKRLDTLHSVQLCTPSSVAAGLLNINFNVNGDIPPEGWGSNLKIVDMFVERGYLSVVVEFPTTKVELYTKYCGDPVDVKKQQLDMYNTIRLKYADMLISQLSNTFSNLVKDLKKKFDDMTNEYEKRLSDERESLEKKIRQLKDENRKLKERLSYLIDAAKKMEEEEEQDP